MVSLSDTELSAVMDAARPIPPRSRDQFLCEVASELAKHDELGPGLVGRVVRDLQPRFLVAPFSWRREIEVREAGLRRVMWIMSHSETAAFLALVTLMVALALA